MQTHQLFELALGLKAPWTVSKIEFSEKDNRLDLWLDFPEGSKFACPVCGQGCGVYDTEPRTWRHLNFFQHQTYLHARVPRTDCPQDKIKTVEVPWARSGSGFTLLMDAFILALAQHGMTPAQIGRIIDEHDTRVWRVLRHYVDEARARKDYSEVRAVGMDETSKARGHQYVTVFMDLGEREIMFVTDGKDAETVKRFREDLEAHGGKAENIQEVCLDMSNAFINGVEAYLPEAQMTFDNFHLAQIVSQAVDEVRRQEQANHPELAGTRYIWLKNQWNLTEHQTLTLERLRGGHLKTAKAYLLRNVFQDIFLPGNKDQAPRLLQQWYFWATHSRITPMIEAAKTIKRHWDGVLRWFSSRISNGLLEAMNGLIQSAKRKSRGFRSLRNFTTIIYLIGSNLDFHLPSMCPTHTK